MWNCLECQDKFFVNNLFDVKANYEHALPLLSNCPAFLGLGEFGLFQSSSHVQIMLKHFTQLT
jgi:hypothetical protein